jgi:MFS family permease
LTTPTKLLNKNFFLLWQGQLVSQLGNQVHYIAVMFWIKHATGSAALMGTLMMAAMLPGVLLGPVGGTFADMYSRKKIIVMSDVLCGIGVLIAGGMLIYMPDEKSAIIALLFVLAVFVGIVSSFFRPAIQASIPDLVPTDKVQAANSMNQSSMQVSLFIGQGIGGVLFRILGAPMLFIIDGLTYLFSAFSESFIKIPQVIPEKANGASEKLRKFRTDMVEGMKYVWQRRGMRDLFVAATFLNFFSSPFPVLMPFYVEDHLGVAPDWFGFILAAFGAGALIGYAIAGALKISGAVRSRLIIILLFVQGIQFGLFGIIYNPFLAVSVTLLMGVFSGIINVYIITILQITTPGEIRGRVFGLLQTIAGGLMPLGMGLGGVAAEMLNNNVALIFMISGVTTALCMIVVSISRPFREYLAYEPPVEEAT